MIPLRTRRDCIRDALISTIRNRGYSHYAAWSMAGEQRPDLFGPEPAPPASPGLVMNRDFSHPSDGWYHIEPKGVHQNASAGLEQVIDDAACVAIVAQFNGEAQAQDFAGMLVDHEHFKHEAGKETRAYGWATRLENRADGIYAKIRWTGTGKGAVDNGDYRYFSTEYDPADLMVLNRQGTRVRPLRLAGLTLTNSPNNKGGRPITNRGDASAGRAGGMAQYMAAMTSTRPLSAGDADILSERHKQVAKEQDAASQRRRANNLPLCNLHETVLGKWRDLVASFQTNGISFSDAWDAARAKSPDLFALAAHAREAGASGQYICW